MLTCASETRSRPKSRLALDDASIDVTIFYPPFDARTQRAALKLARAFRRRTVGAALP